MKRAGKFLIGLIVLLAVFAVLFFVNNRLVSSPEESAVSAGGENSQEVSLERSKTSTTEESKQERSEGEEVSEEEKSEVSEKPVIMESNTEEISKIEFSTDIEYVKPYETLEECISDSESIKGIIEDISNEENSNTDSTVKIEENTKLVFERTLKENITYSETFAQDTEKALEEKKEQFVEIVNLFEWGIDNDNITVVVRYLDNDGKVIFEKEFDNDDEEHSKSEESTDESTSKNE